MSAVRAAAFDYHAPATIDEAVALLDTYGASARVVAGGQSLVPAMAARLARPTHIIDINRMTRAERPSVAAGRLRIPPLMRHVDFETPSTDGPLGKLLAEISHHVGDLPVRMRGTFCGALANGDPAAEWCLAAVVLNADILLRSKARGVRNVQAAAFFETMLSTVAADDEMVVEVQVPILSPFIRWGFAKEARRVGHYGSALSLCLYDKDEDRAVGVRLGVGAVEAVPRRIAEAEQRLEGETPSLRRFREVADAAADAVDPVADDREDSHYKRDLVRAVVRRALEETL